jgi:hypothetical protein
MTDVLSDTQATAHQHRQRHYENANNQHRHSDQYINTLRSNDSDCFML